MFHSDVAAVVVAAAVAVVAADGDFEKKIGRLIPIVENFDYLAEEPGPSRIY